MMETISSTIACYGGFRIKFWTRVCKKLQMLWIKWTWKRSIILLRLSNKILRRWELEEYITSVTTSRNQSPTRRMKGSASSTSILLKSVSSTRDTRNNYWMTIIARKIYNKKMILQSLMDTRLFMMNKKVHNFAWWTIKLLSKDIHKFVQKISPSNVRQKLHWEVKTSETYFRPMNRRNN